MELLKRSWDKRKEAELEEEAELSDTLDPDESFLPVIDYEKGNKAKGAASAVPFKTTLSNLNLSRRGSIGAMPTANARSGRLKLGGPHPPQQLPVLSTSHLQESNMTFVSPVPPPPPPSANLFTNHVRSFPAPPSKQSDRSLPMTSRPEMDDPIEPSSARSRIAVATNTPSLDSDVRKRIEENRALALERLRQKRLSSASPSLVIWAFVCSIICMRVRACACVCVRVLLVEHYL